MSPGRKKPYCHSCGLPMAGHKRPNGAPICPMKTAPEASTSQLPPPASPSPLRREEQVIIPSVGYLRWRNPNWREDPPAPLSALDRAETPASWVSTEPADDIPVKREPSVTAVEPQPMFDDSATPRASPSISSVASSASTLTRSLTEVLSNCVPLITVFGSPKEELTKVTREARRKGLHTAILHKSKQPEIKEELAPTPARQNSWMVLMGHDVDAVSDWCELHDRAMIKHFEQESGVEGHVGTLSRSRGMDSGLPNFVYVVGISIFSSCAMWFLLSCT